MHGSSCHGSSSKALQLSVAQRYCTLSQWAWFSTSTRNFINSGQNSAHQLLENRWTMRSAIVVDTPPLMPIYYDTIEDGQNKKNLIFYSLIIKRLAWWEKKGNLVLRFVENLTTWREILTFDIKKYIRNGGKCNYIPGKDAFFQTLETCTASWRKLDEYIDQP